MDLTGELVFIGGRWTGWGWGEASIVAVTPTPTAPTPTPTTSFDVIATAALGPSIGLCCGLGLDNTRGETVGPKPVNKRIKLTAALARFRAAGGAGATGQGITVQTDTNNIQSGDTSTKTTQAATPVAMPAVTTMGCSRSHSFPFPTPSALSLGMSSRSSKWAVGHLPREDAETQ